MFTRVSFKKRNNSLKAYRWYAPVKGLCDQRHVSAGRELHALYLENWVPEKDGLKLRPGFKPTQTLPVKEDIRRLFSIKIGQNEHRLAVTNRSIFDLSKDEEPVLLKDGFGSGKWRAVSFLNRLIMVNGRDMPVAYDGKTLTSLELNIKGDPFSEIITYRNRIYMMSKNDTVLYYLEYNVFGGKVNEFDLSSVMRKGGTLKALITFSLDGGTGPHEVLAIITSEGEVILYRGNDPSSAEAFELIGIYEIPKLISSELICHFGEDVLLGTEAGFIPLYGSLPLGMKTEKRNYSAVISKTLLDLMHEQKDYFGWQMTHIPHLQWLIIHCPSGEQLIYHTGLHAWTKFTGLNATSWCEYKDGIYFSRANGIYKLDDHRNDDGLPIEAKLITVFHDFNTPLHLKQIKQMKLTLEVGNRAYVTDQRLISNQQVFGFQDLEWLVADSININGKEKEKTDSNNEFIEGDFLDEIFSETPSSDEAMGMENEQRRFVEINQHGGNLGREFALLFHVKSDDANLVLREMSCTYIVGGLS